ncbi:winged helix-turn-helix transcriptional regulator [Streptomyces sp. NPDC057474]|uniref:winged helix-turn-helix transcriptional regulator n=1 Tax=Streptomyces sp. NPDC057474 TaxID=3346144 RepID=UPI0036C004DC
MTDPPKWILLGDWWTPLVLREACYGILRLDAFQESLGIARNTLTDRLRRLVAEGLLEKRPNRRSQGPGSVQLRRLMSSAR